MSGLLSSAPVKLLPAVIASAAAAPVRKKSLLFIVVGFLSIYERIISST